MNKFEINIMNKKMQKHFLKIVTSALNPKKDLVNDLKNNISLEIIL
jgi:hypothetical protein